MNVVKLFCSDKPLVDHIATIKNLSTNDILYITDTINVEKLEKIIKSTGTPGYIVGDNAGFVKCDLPIFSVPFRSLDLEWKFLQIQHFLPANTNTKFCFNFIINKVQINRHLCMKLVEWFELSSFAYTWSGVKENFDLSYIINEINQTPQRQWSEKFFLKLLQPISIPPQWVSSPLPIERKTNSSVVNYGSNRWTWKNIFKDLMSESAISLITESQWTQKSCVFTEKTIYAVMALTVPIWIGGYGHAEYFKSMGFDIFEDYINHDYQYQDTLIERCYDAFDLNLGFLNSLNQAQDLRKKLMPRLLANRELMMSDVFYKHTINTLQQWPDDLAQAMSQHWKRPLSHD
jgi:hypothetical protein